MLSKMGQVSVINVTEIKDLQNNCLIFSGLLKEDRMAVVYYKFKSSLNYDTLPVEGHNISLGELKKAIISAKKLGKNTEFDLQVTNAQTKEGKHGFIACV